MHPVSNFVKATSQGVKAHGIRSFSSAFADQVTKVSSISNGLRVATESSSSEMATLGVWVDSGSRHETPEKNGVAHFLEHMAFKGTSNRTQRNLEVEIENMGGNLNAFTSREQTAYYATVFKDDVPKAMEILSDILLNASYDEKAIEAERHVILREAEEVAKQPDEVLFDRFHETAFQTSTLGQTILGPAENIQSISRQDLKDFVNNNYVGDKMVVAAAGGVDHEQVAQLTEQYFSGVAKTSPNPRPEQVEPVQFIGSDVRYRDDDKEVAQFVLGFEGPSVTSPDAVPMMLIQGLLGSWSRTHGFGANMASKLCLHVAERDLCHSISAFNSAYKDLGIFGVNCVADKYQLWDVSHTIMDNFVHLSTEVTEAQVDIAKAQLKASLMFGLDGTGHVCEDIGRQMLTFGRRISRDELFKRIDLVDAKEVMRVADKYIVDQDLVLAAEGPLFEMPDYNFLRRHTYSLLN